MDYLTFEGLLKLKGRFHVYPRKHTVCIDGFKYYKVSPGTIAKWNYYLKNNVEVKP